MSNQAGPLTGITVVAIEQAVAAPLCTARLADAGARVIKVERPGGDFARAYDSHAGGDSTYFGWLNHGKESVVLDLTTTDDAELLRALLGQADVFVQNLAPGAADRLGFGSSDLRAQDPRLITCDISGYGEDPSVADKRAYDLLVQAESGLVAVSGGEQELGRIGVSLCDIGTGVTAHAAILEALIGRSVSGEGASLAVSLFDVAAEWMTVPLVHYEADGVGPQRVGLKHPSIAPYGAFATADGQLTLISIQNEREWKRLCDDVLGEPTMATDARFDSGERRVEHRAALESEMSGILRTLDATEFRARLSNASIAWGAVSSLADLADHVALRRRAVTSTTGVDVSLPAHPVRRDRPMTSTTAGQVPAVGQHTDAIRAEFR